IIAVVYIPVMLFLLIKLSKHKNVEQKNIEKIGGINNDRISFE
ncbi:MFS transporter, partial [Clostridium beijerinckii]|nr:MFS transporter [Clostridium beijerinckii]